MSDNIIDFNKRRRERIESQPVSEVSMESLMQGLTSAPRNELMADVAMAVNEKITRLLILTDIASKASDMLSAFGFDPNNFYLEVESLNRYLSGDMDDGEEAMWNGPFFDWDADDEYNTTVRVVTTIRTSDEDDEDDVSIQLAMELFKLGEDDEQWSRFVDGEWLQDGPPADIFDMLDLVDFDGDEDDDDEDGAYDWEDDDEDDENSIYMFDLSAACMKALTFAGIDTLDQLKDMSDAQLAAIPGLTERDISRIKRVLSCQYDDVAF